MSFRVKQLTPENIKKKLSWSRELGFKRMELCKIDITWCVKNEFVYFVGDLNVMYNKKLTPTDKLVYYCLVGFMNAADGKCYPRYATIKERTGISISSIQRSVKHLAKHKLITIKRLASTNLYFLGTQKILQETIKKRVRGKFDISDKSERGVLIKPSYITNKYNKNVNNSNRLISSPSLKNNL